MKTSKMLFSVLFTMIALVTVTSCGDKTQDPQPTIPVWVGYWKFQSAVVTPLVGADYTITSLCSSSVVPQFNVEYQLTTEKDALQKSPCLSDAFLTYVPTLTNGKMTSIEFKNQGMSSGTYTNVVIDEVNKIITANKVDNNTKSIVITFKIQ